MKIIQRKLQIIKQASGGSYSGVEMKEESVLPMPDMQSTEAEVGNETGNLPSVLKKER